MNFVAAEKCPLCQSRLKNGECPSCGYKLPDEGDISALYNYDPSDYPQEQPAVREITPKVQMEEIYPNRPEPIDFKVRNDDGKTVQSPYGQNNGGYGQPTQQGQQNYYGNNGQYQQNGQYGGQNRQNGHQPYNQTYYSSNGQYGNYPQQGQYGGQNRQNGQPYQPYYKNNGQHGNYPQFGQYGGYNNQNQPYYRNNGGYQQYNGNSSQGTGDLKEFLAKYWWLLLISFFFPFIGTLGYILLVRSNVLSIERKYRTLIITAIVLGYILPPWT